MTVDVPLGAKMNENENDVGLGSHRIEDGGRKRDFTSGNHGYGLCIGIWRWIT